MDNFSIVRSEDAIGRVIVAVDGEVDMASAGALSAALEEELAGGRTVILDCSMVSFMDSSGLRALLRASQAAGRSQAKFVIVRPQPAVARVLELAGVSDLLDVRESLTAVVDSED